MQILYTYTKLPIYKRLDGSDEEFQAPNPESMHLDRTDAQYKPVTWAQTGRFCECNGCIVFQWRGTFDHEREADEREAKARSDKFAEKLKEINEEFERNIEDIW